MLDSHFQNMRALEANTVGRAEASSAVRRFCGDDPSLVVAGDFNLPIESSIFRRYWSDLGNAFSRRGSGFGWTRYTRWHGARIDQILFGREWDCFIAASDPTSAPIIVPSLDCSNGNNEMHPIALAAGATRVDRFLPAAALHTARQTAASSEAQMGSSPTVQLKRPNSKSGF